jgi:membrane-associated phospholipid phosphatase
MGTWLAMGVLAQEAKEVSGTEAGDMNEPATIPAADAPKSSTSGASTAIQAPVEKKHRAPQLLLDFAEDQRALWTSPARLRFRDTTWLVPLSGIAAGLFVTDSDFSRHLSHDPKTLSHYSTLSNAGVAALVGGAGGMWVLSHFNHNSHWRETGFLAEEAAVNSLAMTETLKYSFRRERPYQGDGTGPFFQPGGTSFPSEHAAAAWSVASMVAHEYPGPLTKILAYGAASLVSYSRVRGEKHFPSDVVVGALLGELAAHEVYKLHHDPELGGDVWNDPAHIFFDDGHSRAGFVGSPYVPLDSWIYPAFDRLAAMGLIDSGFAGMRPWTRSECARLLGETADHVDEGIGGAEAEKIYRALESEFRDELESTGREGRLRGKVESVYARVTSVSGQPLTDGNHFGQTIVNDYGRPFQKGFNSVDGFSAWSASGPWVGYVRAEYQHAPSAPAPSPAVRQFIASVDSLPGVPPATPYPSVNRFQVLDAYVGLNLESWQFSFGRESLWWSPMHSGPLMFSDNAEPVDMFRIDRVSPFKLPWIAGWLGPMRFDWFLGQFAGHEFVHQTDTGTVGQFGQPIGRQPFLEGVKLSMKPTPNFEFSVSWTNVFAGGPGPLTWHTFLHSYSPGNSLTGGGPDDPGDRRSGVDFSYRIPGLRNWLTFYGDAFTEDEFSPLGYPRKSAVEGGIYLARVPGISKLDLRLEGGTTAPVDFPGCVGCFYVNGRYPGGSYLNNGNLAGSWLGRAGQSESAWSTYWLSPRSSIQLQYRHQKVDGDYLPFGGTLNDGGVKVDLQLKRDVTFSGLVQYEKWNYPVIAPQAQSNWTTSVGVTFWPRNWQR